MLATLSFEIGADRVLETMRVLALQESVTLHSACVTLERLEADNMVEELTSALKFINATVHQLQQYRDMLVGFERARFEERNTADHPVGDSNTGAAPPSLAETTKIMEQWDAFIDKINQANVRNEDDDAEEG